MIQDPQGSASVSGRRFRIYRWPFTPSLPSATQLGCHSVTTDNFPGTSLLSDSLKVYQNSRQGFFCPLTPWGHFLSPITTPHLHPTTAPGRPETSKHAGCIFALACLPGCWGTRLLKSKLSEGSRRVGGRTVHSQLVDGVLRDDRVGGEVGDHVGATEAAGAGGRRLPFAGQRAQGHGAGSGRTGPHPAPGPARVRGARVGHRQAGGAGSAGSRRPSWARRVARRQPPQPWGSAVQSRQAGAASSPPQAASGAGLRYGWAGRAPWVGPAAAPPRSSWHPPDPAARVRTRKNGPPDSVVWAKEESWVSKKG